MLILRERRPKYDNDNPDCCLQMNERHAFEMETDVQRSYSSQSEHQSAKTPNLITDQLNCYKNGENLYRISKGSNTWTAIDSMKELELTIKLNQELIATFKSKSQIIQTTKTGITVLSFAASVVDIIMKLGILFLEKESSWKTRVFVRTTSIVCSLSLAGSAFLYLKLKNDLKGMLKILDKQKRYEKELHSNYLKLSDVQSPLKIRNDSKFLQDEDFLETEQSKNKGHLMETRTMISEQIDNSLPDFLETKADSNISSDFARNHIPIILAMLTQSPHYKSTQFYYTAMSMLCMVTSTKIPDKYGIENVIAYLRDQNERLKQMYKMLSVTV